MPRLRIGYYLPSYPGGGTARHLLALIDHLRGGHDITFFCDQRHSRASFAEELGARNIPVRITGRRAKKSAGALEPVLANLPDILPLRRLFKAARLDVIHFHAGKTSPLYAPMVASRLAEIPARILTVHNQVSRHPFLKRYFEGRALGSVQRIVGVCEDIRREVARRKNVAAKRVIVIPNGVDPADFAAAFAPGEARRALGIAEGALVAGMVSRPSRLKGADILIRAAAAIRPQWPSLRIVLFGASREEPGMRRLAAGLGVADIVLFAGFRADARRLLGGFDLSVVSSRHESLPYAILEAMACGLPVVGARVGGIPEAVDDGVTGLLFPSEDVPALAAALSKLLGDPEKRRAMGAAGRRRVESHFSQAAMLAATVSLYETLAAGNG